jgi:hypothetical protein
MTAPKLVSEEYSTSKDASESLLVRFDATKR